MKRRRSPDERHPGTNVKQPPDFAALIRAALAIPLHGLI